MTTRRGPKTLVPAGFVIQENAQGRYRAALQRAPDVHSTWYVRRREAMAWCHKYLVTGLVPVAGPNEALAEAIEGNDHDANPTMARSPVRVRE